MLSLFYFAWKLADGPFCIHKSKWFLFAVRGSSCNFALWIHLPHIWNFFRQGPEELFSKCTVQAYERLSSVILRAGTVDFLQYLPRSGVQQSMYKNGAVFIIPALL